MTDETTPRVTSPVASELVLRSVNDLLSERFVIPSYQRGYRWTSRQVLDLLQDLDEFAEAVRDQKLSPDEFYCLQPVVVLPRDDGSWEVIDGQQRLTTLYLLLKADGQYLEYMQRSPFELRYETRERSESFLQDPGVDSFDDNIDFHHMSRAYHTIVNWLEGRERLPNNRLFNLLFEDRQNARVIWYVLPHSHDAIDAFVRLNVGKIPLTNAELIRALFLRSQNFDGKPQLSRMQVGAEWDAIEKLLQNEELWYFLKGVDDHPTRIEFIFSILVQMHGYLPDQGDPYSLFINFDQWYRDKPDDEWTLEDRWREVKQIALRIEEWFRDRELYHLIGHLIRLRTAHNGQRQSPEQVVVELLARRETMKRAAFVTYLKKEILNWFSEKKPSDIPDKSEPREIVRSVVTGLTYGHDNDRIRSTLLLFNIGTLLENTGSQFRFPFDLYEKQSWDIEHIRSVTDYRPQRVDDQKAWLQQVVRYWATTSHRTDHYDLLAESRKLLENFETRLFDALYQRIVAYFEEEVGTEVDNSLGNLTLLDSKTNRSYKNAVFPVKRQIVLQLDKIGTFVPLATTNVFLKYYSREEMSLLLWKKKDAEAYQEVIIETLTGFFFGGEA